jgi:hypothetical protein
VGWEVIRQGNDLFITGPGLLDIALYDFDPAKVRVKCNDPIT